MGTERNPWSILAVFMAAPAVNDGFLSILPPFLPAIREHFQLSCAEAGAFYTLFRFFAGASGLS